MLPTCHLFNMGHAGCEVLGANIFMLSLVVSVKEVIASDFLAPLENVIKKKLVTHMQDFTDKEEGQISEPPVPPKGKVYSK